MPSLTANNSKVLVTGANGYIGLWTVKVLLDRGFSVRAVVRNESKEQALKELFSQSIDTGKLEFSYVGDLTKEGAYDEAVQGVDAVLHLASPLPSASPDPEDSIRPAVDGTVGVLKSAIKNGTNIKRIVVTSSISSQTTESTERRVYTEADWNERVDDDIKSGNMISVYRASKTLAEKAAWDLYNANKSSIAWDLTMVNPAFTFGPPLDLVVASPSDLGFTQGYWWSSVMSALPEKTKEAFDVQNGSAWVDVRDVAEAHVRALEKEDAANERITAVSDAFVMQEWLNIAKAFAPASILPSMPKGYPEITNSGKLEYLLEFDNSKSKRILGMEYRTKEDTVRDILKDAERRGWF